MTLNRIFIGVILSAIGMAAFSGYAWFQIPDDAQIAIHWNIQGEIDNYASKGWGLFTTPLIALAMGGLLKALPHMEPRRKNLEKSPKLVGATWIGVMMVMWVAHITVVGTALGWQIDIIQLITIAIGFMMLLIGNYAAKSKSMFMVGIRTPWTLSSDTVWAKTHRLGGRLFMLGGIVMIVAPLTLSAREVFGYIVFGGVMVPVLISLVYSWWVWKQEQAEK